MKKIGMVAITCIALMSCGSSVSSPSEHNAASDSVRTPTEQVPPADTNNNSSTYGAQPTDSNHRTPSQTTGNASTPASRSTTPGNHPKGNTTHQ